ncbi:hypothetical protein GGD54_003682 [Rhizobium tropici]|uniref:Uncharacterized protein n=1 Tax=Rhizobium tropici TaxID=398 RepID=A0ABR6R242_RHITR|nr:hypothetical protein [Rhizobium tropici]MBB5594652.1 hypothetical protein [Rhizobium tropici]MBB6493259.1 hypothetical protein [Rhizobium tropici]
MPIFRRSFARPIRLRSARTTDSGYSLTENIRRIAPDIFRKPSQKIALVNGELPPMIGRNLVI